MTNIKSKPAAQAAKRPHVTDALAVKIGEVYRALIAMETSAQEVLEKVEQQWIALGGMLIDVRLREKGHFTKWIKANEATLGFGRSKAYDMIKIARSTDVLDFAVFRENRNMGRNSISQMERPASRANIGIAEHRRAAAERAAKSRANLNDRIAALETFEQAERDKRETADPKNVVPFISKRARQAELSLEFCSANDPVYLDIRSRHYVVQKGTHGQQVHFKVWYRGKCVGIISGASAVYATESRDAFFKLTKDNRTRCLNGIIDNTVFRLELHEHNLASRIVSLWEKSVVWVWENLYEVKVFGFETFIIPEGFTTEEVLDAKRRVVLVDDPTGKNMRKGGAYRAVGWTLAGRTSPKRHDEEVPPKDVYCKWVPGFSAPVESEYRSSWKAGTPQEKALAKRRSGSRRALLGTRFFLEGRTLIHEDIKQEPSNVIKLRANDGKRSSLERAWTNATEPERAAFVSRFRNELAALLSNPAAQEAS